MRHSDASMVTVCRYNLKSVWSATIRSYVMEPANPTLTHRQTPQTPRRLPQLQETLRDVWLNRGLGSMVRNAKLVTCDVPHRITLICVLHSTRNHLNILLKAYFSSLGSNSMRWKYSVYGLGGQNHTIRLRFYAAIWTSIAMFIWDKLVFERAK